LQAVESTNFAEWPLQKFNSDFRERALYKLRLSRLIRRSGLCDSVGIPQANSRGEIAEIEAFEKGSKPTTG